MEKESIGQKPLAAQDMLAQTGESAPGMKGSSLPTDSAGESQGGCPGLCAQANSVIQRISVSEQQLTVLLDQVTKERDKAETANRSKSEFLANMSHELRTPLHAILSFASFGEKNAASAKPEKITEYFHKIQNSGKILLNLVNNLLDLAKLESGKMVFEFQRTNLCTLLGKVADEFTSLVSERGLTIDYVEPASKAMANVDRDKFMQVIRNLVSNAVKFSPQGGKIGIDIAQEGHLLQVRVTDQGAGIPPAELEKIFEEFVQSSTTKTGAGGTGLGLAISRQIAAAHKGRIWAENQPQGGAVFFFEIPLATDDGLISLVNLNELQAR